MPPQNVKVDPQDYIIVYVTYLGCGCGFVYVVCTAPCLRLVGMSYFINRNAR